MDERYLAERLLWSLRALNRGVMAASSLAPGAFEMLDLGNRMTLTALQRMSMLVHEPPHVANGSNASERHEAYVDDLRRLHTFGGKPVEALIKTQRKHPADTPANRNGMCHWKNPALATIELNIIDDDARNMLVLVHELTHAWIGKLSNPMLDQHDQRFHMRMLFAYTEVMLWDRPHPLRMTVDEIREACLAVMALDLAVKAGVERSRCNAS